MTNLTGISRVALAVALTVGCQSAAFAQEVAMLTTPSAAAEPGAGPDDSIIVTGTRVTGMTAAESAAPIKVLGAEMLEHVGQPNLNQVLTQLVPSFTAQAFGGDTANLTLSARLRGLSPNHTLVLVNGKRRHGTSNLAVLGGPYQGAATADLDLISPSSIKRIEVLEDGAAAQYGSDAIAGVINIILKDDSEGASGYATAGEHYDTGGRTYAGTVHLGTKLGEDGFLNVTAFHRFHDFTQVGGLDRNVTDTEGNLRTTLSAAQRALYANIPGFPYVNKINGDARSHLTNAQYNMQYDFGPVQFYSFGTYSRRIASAYENLRRPDRIIRSAVLGTAGVLGAAGTTVFDPNGDNPSNGFSPREKIRENDYAVTAGTKTELAGFRTDLSVTYGEDKNQIFTIDSANASLYIDTGVTPTQFYDGLFRASELTYNADFSREFEMGMATPLNVAFGYEHRRNRYQIGAGDPTSYYKEGAQSFPGFRPSDAKSISRNNEAVYVDVAASPVEGLKLDAAARYEHYSDFGGTTNYKATARYDFSDMFALRGTVASGFRAPTLAESFYSATNVSPTAAIVQLPANSAAAKILGFDNLAPEKSRNYSVGAVIRPASRLTVTVDAYQVRIRDRILGTGTLYSAGGARNFALVRTAVVANGNILDPTVTQTGISVFANGATTRTRGVDIVASYLTDLGDAGRINWTLAGNYNKTKAIRIDGGPVLTDTTGLSAAVPLFNASTIANLESASPRVKIVGSAFYTVGPFSATLRETMYGRSSSLASPNGGTFYKQQLKTAAITDLELNYSITPAIEFSLGANNLFDKRPGTVQLVPGTTNFTLVNGGNVLDAPLTFSPYGINGGYYYARINFSF